MAVVKKADTIIAFSNLWQSANKAELSVDLMRYDPVTAPKGVMRINLFISAHACGAGIRATQLVRS